MYSSCFMVFIKLVDPVEKFAKILDEAIIPIATQEAFLQNARRFALPTSLSELFIRPIMSSRNSCFY